MQTVNPWLWVLDGIKFHHTLKTRSDPAPRVWWNVTIISHTKWHQMLTHTHTHKTHQIPRKQQPNQLPACWLWALVVLKRWCFVEQVPNQNATTNTPPLRRLSTARLDYQKFVPRWQVYCLDRRDLACGKAWGEESTRHWRPLTRLPVAIHNDGNEVMFEVSMVKTLLTLVNTSCSSSFELVVEDTLVFEKYGKLAHLNHLTRWMTVKDTKCFYQSKRWLDPSR